MFNADFRINSYKFEQLNAVCRDLNTQVVVVTLPVVVLGCAGPRTTLGMRGPG